MKNLWIKIEKFFWGILLFVTFLFLLWLRYTNFEWNTKGVLFFFLVPLWIWGIGTLFIRRSEFTARVLAFIEGSDNRLSLSRLQAFAWTLVIFGSWVAAMGIHTKIIPITQVKANEYTEQAKIAKTRSDALKINWDKANAEYIASEQAKHDADKSFLAAEATAKALADNNQSADTIKKAQDEANQLKIKADEKAILLKGAETNKNDAEKIYQEALVNSVEIENTVSGLNWVNIPAALLALAGIAIGSGIFSSVISAVNSEDKTACLTSIILITADQFKLDHPDLPLPASNNLLKIKGKDLGKTGKVRLGSGRIFSVYAPTPFWNEDGSEIVAVVPLNTFYDTIETVKFFRTQNSLCSSFYFLTLNVFQTGSGFCSLKPNAA